MRTILPAIIASLALSLLSANAQGTAFTYQGVLTDNGEPANGKYGFRFAVFDASSGGNQQGGTVFKLGQTVSNGLFTVTLDFGVLSAAERWLEIAVRTGGGAFTNLSPRQRLTPVPYSITAGNISGTLPASQLSGTISLAQLPDSVVTTNQSGVEASPLGSLYRNWTRRGNAAPYNLDDDGARTVLATTNDFWATNYVILTNFPGIEGSCVFVSKSNNFNAPSLYWTFTNLDNIRGVDVEVLWVTNGANSLNLGYSRSLNISFSEWPALYDPASPSTFRLSGRNGAHFNYHADGAQLHFFTNLWYVVYSEEDYLGRAWVDTWTGKQPGLATFKPQHGSIWHCGFEFMSPTTIRVYSGPNEWIRSLDFFTNFDNVHSFWLESAARDATNLSISACIRSTTVFTHHKNTWPRWLYVTTNGLVLTQTVVTN